MSDLTDELDDLDEVEYRTIEGDVSEDTLELYLDLLHTYLSKFISREALRSDLQYCFQNGRVVGAYLESELIAAVAGVYTPFFDKFHIAHIAVVEDHQGRGIGEELTKKVIPDDTGASVHLNKGNPGIEEFYEKMGFEATHTRFKRSTGEDKKPSD